MIPRHLLASRLGTPPEDHPGASRALKHPPLARKGHLYPSLTEKLRRGLEAVFEEFRAAWMRPGSGLASERLRQRYERKLWMRDLVMGVAYPPVDS